MYGIIIVNSDEDSKKIFLGSVPSRGSSSNLRYFLVKSPVTREFAVVFESEKLESIGDYRKYFLKSFHRGFATDKGYRCAMAKVIKTEREFILSVGGVVFGV